MRVVLVLVMAVACGGGGDESTPDTATSEIPTWKQNAQTGTSGEGPCADVPTFNFDNMDCESLAVAFTDIVEAADECEKKTDCTIVHPACETWNQVFCYYPVNVCLDQTVISEINSNAGNCISGTIEGCSCGGAPEVDCVSGRCQFVYNF